MYDHDLANRFGLLALLQIGCASGRAISKEKLNRKKRNMIKINYGDTIFGMIQHKQYELNSDLFNMFADAFLQGIVLSEESVRNIKAILTKKRYNEISTFVMKNILTLENVRFFEELRKHKEEKKSTIESALEEAKVDYTPQGESSSFIETEG